MELLRQMPDESVSMILTDPPYGISYQTLIVIWITVKPCKKISMGIFFQDTVTLSGKLLIVYAIVTLQHPMLSVCEIILVGNPIRRV